MSRGSRAEKGLEDKFGGSYKWNKGVSAKSILEGTSLTCTPEAFVRPHLVLLVLLRLITGVPKMLGVRTAVNKAVGRQVTKVASKRPTLSRNGLIHTISRLPVSVNSIKAAQKVCPLLLEAQNAGSKISSSSFPS